MSLQNTPQANRLHIAFFGRRNAGKSSLMNRFANQNVAIVSDIPGTTTDPVTKSMELHPLGPVALIDTAGFDDEGLLGEARIAQTRNALKKTDVAVMVLRQGCDLSFETEWLESAKKQGTVAIAAVNACDLHTNYEEYAKCLSKQLDIPVCNVSALTGQGLGELQRLIIENAPTDFELPEIATHLVEKGAHVLLVAPQDIQAPKGRLILPQQQVIRDLLDGDCSVTVVTAKMLDEGLQKQPDLVICDSQVVKQVYDKIQGKVPLTTFSVLMARYKGDIQTFIQGAAAIDNLKAGDRVLIAEACTHNALDGDIARILLPKLLNQAVPGIITEIASGKNFLNHTQDYALVIHCGACMFNRRYMLSRINQCKQKSLPMTNYGVAISKLTGILDKLVY